MPARPKQRPRASFRKLSRSTWLISFEALRTSDSDIPAAASRLHSDQPDRLIAGQLRSARSPRKYVAR